MISKNVIEQNNQSENILENQKNNTNNEYGKNMSDEDKSIK